MDGLNVEMVLSPNQWTVYENSSIQKFIDAGGEIYLINETDKNNIGFDKYCIIDYSTVINDDFKTELSVKPTQGNSFLKENQETLVEKYINEYLLLKNNYCKNCSDCPA